MSASGVEGSEQFVKAGNGKPLPGHPSHCDEKSVECVMLEAFERGHVHFQMFFGNKGWEPEASHIKKQFEDAHDCWVRKKGWHSPEFAQEEGD